MGSMTIHGWIAVILVSAGVIWATSTDSVEDRKNSESHIEAQQFQKDFDNP